MSFRGRAVVLASPRAVSFWFDTPDQEYAVAIVSLWIRVLPDEDARKPDPSLGD